MQLGFPQILSFLSGHDFIVEDERALTSLDPEVTTDALYYVRAADEMLTRLIKITPEENFEAVQAKGPCSAGIILRLKIKAIARGLKKMGISETFNIGDVLRPDSKIIRYLFSRIIYFHDYLFAFKQQVAPALKNLVPRPYPGPAQLRDLRQRRQSAQTRAGAGPRPPADGPGSRRGAARPPPEGRHAPKARV